MHVRLRGRGGNHKGKGLEEKRSRLKLADRLKWGWGAVLGVRQSGKKGKKARLGNQRSIIPAFWEEMRGKFRETAKKAPPSQTCEDRKKPPHATPGRSASLMGGKRAPLRDRKTE